MSDTPTIVHKAQRTVSDWPVPDLHIAATLECPRTSTLDELRAVHVVDAERIEAALHASLPGGTYDQLAGLMLRRVASMLIISRKECGP